MTNKETCRMTKDELLDELERYIAWEERMVEAADTVCSILEVTCLNEAPAAIQAKDDEINRLHKKLDRVIDFFKFEANCEGGIVHELEVCGD